MIRVLPFGVAAAAGMWAGVLASEWVSLPQVAALAAAMGALNAGYSAWAEKIDTKLGELDRLAVAERRVQQRLTERIRARRARLVAKRVAVFIAGVLAMAAAGIFPLAPNETLQAVSIIVSMSGAAVGAVGCVLLFIESTELDERVAELQRYVDRLNASTAEAARIKAAGQRERS